MDVSANPDRATTIAVNVDASPRFFGRNSIVVDDARIRSLSTNLTDIMGHIMLSEPEQSPWRKVVERLVDWMQIVNDPTRNVYEYQIEITSEVIIPYLRKLQDRYSTDSSRSKQIMEVLETIMHDDIPHPAVCFQQLDKIVEEVKLANQSYFFSSELLTLLQQSQAKQWRPILMDLRGFLQDISGKLVAVAVLTIIGWPMIMLSPLLFNMKKIMNMIHEFERHQRISSESIMLLLQIVVVMLALMKILSILQVYQSIGYACGGLAAICILIASSDSLMKVTAPIVAPNARLLDQMVQRLMHLNIPRLGI